MSACWCGAKKHTLLRTAWAFFRAAIRDADVTRDHEEDER